MEREYYSLDDAAALVGCSVNDMIHFGVIGKLKIFALMPGKSATECEDDDEEETEFQPRVKFLRGPYQLLRTDVQLIEAGANGPLRYIYARKDDNLFLPIWQLDDPIPFCDLKLIVMADFVKAATHEAPVTANHTGTGAWSPEEIENLSKRYKELGSRRKGRQGIQYLKAKSERSS